MIWGKTAKACGTAGGMANWCSNWFGGRICARVCQLGGHWRIWCSSFSKQTGSSICRQLFSRQ
jgi:hypothetical protein